MNGSEHYFVFKVQKGAKFNFKRRFDFGSQLLIILWFVQQIMMIILMFADTSKSCSFGRFFFFFGCVKVCTHELISKHDSLDTICFYFVVVKGANGVLVIADNKAIKSQFIHEIETTKKEQWTDTIIKSIHSVCNFKLKVSTVFLFKD